MTNQTDFLEAVRELLRIAQTNGNQLSMEEINNYFSDMRLEEQQIKVELTKAAKDAIVEAAYDPQYGARPLRRYVQHTVETMLSKRLLKGDITPGQTVTVDAVDGELAMR